MTQVLVTESHLNDIAESIRGKSGLSRTYTPGQMAGAIDALPTSELGTKTITANGSYMASADQLDGYSQVTVDVPNSYTASDEGKVVQSGALVAQTAMAQQITANGTYDTTANNSVVVNVSGGGSWNEPAVIIDNPNNATSSFEVRFDEIPSTGGSPTGSETLDYLFVYGDNQTTNIQIGDVQHLSSEMFTWSANGDKAYTVAGRANFTDGSINETMGAGDSGNHACTLVGYTGKALKSSQAVREALSASVTAGEPIANAYVVFLFCVYGGGNTVNVDLNGESIAVPRYSTRYSNSNYVLVRKVSGISSGDVITVQITDSITASKVIGMLGVFA